jgi:hypothetical protein
MLFAVVAVLYCKQFETGQHAYMALQRRLDKSQTLEVTKSYDSPPERDIKCKIVRPHRGSMSGLGVHWWTDGTRTVENDDFGKFSRAARPEDLKEMGLIGFESFYDPKAKVSVLGDLEAVALYERQYLTIDLKIKTSEYKLYLDSKTRLPALVEDVRIHVKTWYSNIRLDPLRRQKVTLQNE